MSYKNFLFQIILRLFLIMANMAMVLFPLFSKPFQNVIFLTFLLSSLLFSQIFILYKKLSKSHRVLNEALKMLNAGQYESSSMPSNSGSIDGIRSSLNKTINSFKELNSKYQSQLNYLELLIENIEVGILSVYQNGKIGLNNTAVQDLLGLKKIRNLSDIKEKHPVLAESIEQSDFERHLILVLKDANSTKQISVKISSIEILGKKQKLVTIQNISGEIIKTETEAWNRLLKILNHEIFNSVTPLSSLSNTLSMIIKNDDGKVKSSEELSDDEIQDIAESIEIIQLRSSNLMNFINGFKKLAKVPPPKIEKISLDKLLNQAALLFKNEAKDKEIEIRITTEAELEINADQSQLEQAIINLISNSIYALEKSENRKIELKSNLQDNKKCITIWDNGHGISEENMDRIFIPFYSTRKNGSGIGLSLTRYLVQLNNGTIEATSEAGKETQFTLVFN